MKRKLLSILFAILLLRQSPCRVLAVEEVNTRIFMQGQMIYIEDMGSPQGTVLNGMRLFSSNRLRSEDEITIGSTVLRVLF